MGTLYRSLMFYNAKYTVCLLLKTFSIIKYFSCIIKFEKKYEGQKCSIITENKKNNEIHKYVRSILFFHYVIGLV